MNAINDVLNGIRTVNNMLADGTIKIGEQCHDARDEFGMYKWEEKATDKDKVVKENDHAMDDIRYFAYTILRDEFDDYEFE